MEITASVPMWLRELIESFKASSHVHVFCEQFVKLCRDRELADNTVKSYLFEAKKSLISRKLLIDPLFVQTIVLTTVKDCEALDDEAKKPILEQLTGWERMEPYEQYRYWKYWKYAFGTKEELNPFTRAL